MFIHMRRTQYFRKPRDLNEMPVRFMNNKTYILPILFLI